MAFGFESGITSFFERRRDFFEHINMEGSFQERMNWLRNQMKAQAHHKPTVVILGGGPGGLLRAIQSISNGNPTVLIEKRSETAPGRINTVALSTTTIAMLQYCGIYQYLVEKRLIFPASKNDDYIMVRLADLELAMKKVISEISPNFAIQYDSKVSAIDTLSEKINLEVEDLSTTEKKSIRKIDILVNTEGKNSSTNALLNIERMEVLPSIPVIAAIYRDKRPIIRGVSTLFKYVGKSLVYMAQTIHYHVQFLFKYACSENFRKQITGSLILKTPNQNYIGCGFSDNINNRFNSLKDEIQKMKLAFEEAEKNGNDQQKMNLAKQLKQAQQKYKKIASHWIHFSICQANLIAIMQRLRGRSSLHTACHHSLDKFEIIKIGADHANEYSKRINQTSLLLGGDAAATVDPTTGLGCNTAIQSSVDFLDFIWDYETTSTPENLLKEYSDRMEERVSYVHLSSIYARSLYRPDAIVPNSSPERIM